MKPAEGLHVEWVDDEAVVLDTTSSQLHYLNPPAALVYALILEHGYESALEELRRTRGGNPQMNEELDTLLKDMTSKGILVDD